MSNLVRMFTCSSVLALSGLTAASFMLACSGDDAPADDGTSTSSSSSSSGSTAKCDPSGTYAFAAPVWSGEDGICVEFAKNLNGGAAATYTYAKTGDGKYDETEGAGSAPNPMTIVPDPDGQCALTGPQSLSNIGVKDGDGKAVKADLKGVVLVVFEGAEATYSGRAELKSQTADAKGLPCNLAFETSGTKK